MSEFIPYFIGTETLNQEAPLPSYCKDATQTEGTSRIKVCSDESVGALLVIVLPIFLDVMTIYQIDNIDYRTLIDRFDVHQRRISIRTLDPSPPSSTTSEERGSVCNWNSYSWSQFRNFNKRGKK